LASVERSDGTRGGRMGPGRDRLLAPLSAVLDNDEMLRWRAEGHAVDGGSA